MRKSSPKAEVAMKNKRNRFGRLLWKAFWYGIATVSLSIVFYGLTALFFSTPEEKRLIRENRMYRDLYPDLLDKERYQVLHVADYVEYRLRSQNVSDVALLRFHSPVSVKYRGQFQNKFNLEAIMAAIERRIFIMNCFEGTFRDETNQRISTEGHIPRLIEESVRFEKKPRYSGAQDKKTCFYGITGTCRISDIDKHALILLLAGELLHIGKNTSFGFGRYTLI